MLDLVLLLEPLSLSIFKQMLVDSFSFKVDLIQRLKMSSINVITVFFRYLALFTMNVNLLESFFSLGGSGYRIVLFFPRHVHFGPDRLNER